MGAANVINATYAAVTRTGGAAGTAWHQRDTGLLYVPPEIKLTSPPSSEGVTTQVRFREGLWIRNFELHNRAAATISVGIGGRIANRHWIAGTLTSDNATFTDRTSGYQAQTATIFGSDADVNDGVCILSRTKFDWVSVNLTTAEVNGSAGASVDHTVRYSTGATWTTLGANAATTDNFTLTDTVYTAAVKNLVMFSPADWAVTASLGGVPNGYYGVLFTSAQAAADDTAAIVTGIEIGKMLALEGLADNGVWEVENIDYYMPEADGIVAYFSTANAGNRVYCEVLTR